MLRSWIVIIGLGAIGLALGWYWLQSNPAPPGVEPMGDADSFVATIAALAGAITTLAGAVSGAAMKWVDYRKAAAEAKALENANLKAQKELENA